MAFTAPWPDYVAPVSQVPAIPNEPTTRLSARTMLSDIVNRADAKGKGGATNTNWGLIAGHALIARETVPASGDTTSKQISRRHGNALAPTLNNNTGWADVCKAYILSGFGLVPNSDPSPADLALCLMEIDHETPGAPGPA